MLIFIPARLTLLSVPKTGTTALEAALSDKADIAFRTAPEIKHMNLRQYRRGVRPLLAPFGTPEFETVAVMRDPVDWLRSWYRFRTRDALIGHPNSTVMVSFEQFIDAWLRPMDQRPAYAQIGTQSDFMRDGHGQIAVTHLFRYEAMAALLHFLGQRLGGSITLPQANISPPAVTDLSPALEARLREALAPEFAVWDSARTG